MSGVVVAVVFDCRCYDVSHIRKVSVIGLVRTPSPFRAVVFSASTDVHGPADHSHPGTVMAPWRAELLRLAGLNLRTGVGGSLRGIRQPTDRPMNCPPGSF